MDHSLPDGETLYAALLSKDQDFEGIFVAGIKTTGIFCRPTCTARKPRRENVEFFATPAEASTFDNLARTARRAIDSGASDVQEGAPAPGGDDEPEPWTLTADVPDFIRVEPVTTSGPTGMSRMRLVRFT